MTEPTKPHVASLSPTDVGKLQDVERQLGNVYVIAYDQPATPAPLTPEQLGALQSLEQEMGVCLVAYRK